jgi:hypothetical protein
MYLERNDKPAKRVITHQEYENKIWDRMYNLRSVNNLCKPVRESKICFLRFISPTIVFDKFRLVAEEKVMRKIK